MNFLPKSEWGLGPWQDEPDRDQWYDAATGLPCLAVRNPMGHWCGYVGVYPGHPLHGVGYSEAAPACGPLDVDDYRRRDGIEHRSPDSVFEVHGGLTYAGACQGHICHEPREGEPGPVFWFGFDCAHCGDLSPESEARARSWRSGPIDGDEYRTLAYVKTECADLACQLKAVA